MYDLSSGFRESVVLCKAQTGQTNQVHLRFGSSLQNLWRKSDCEKVKNTHVSREKSVKLAKKWSDQGINAKYNRLSRQREMAANLYFSILSATRVKTGFTYHTTVWHTEYVRCVFEYLLMKNVVIVRRRENLFSKEKVR